MIVGQPLARALSVSFELTDAGVIMSTLYSAYTSEAGIEAPEQT